VKNDVRSRVLSLASACAVALLTSAGALAAGAVQKPAAADDDMQSCNTGTVPGIHINDYRTRGAATQSTWDAGDVKRNHLDPAMAAMRQGNYSRGVKADLSFVMSSWPNYYPVLEALITYDLGGGKTYDFPTTLCFLERAKTIFPDDVKVRLLEGYYFWKKNDKQRAISSYEDALALDPEASDAHYNLGLVYLEMNQYDKAREHATAAYAAGYPLTGLRNRLAKAGYALAADSPSNN
jgi:tetratricopeptide (TPR) repeat protein